MLPSDTLAPYLCELDDSNFCIFDFVKWENSVAEYHKGVAKSELSQRLNMYYLLLLVSIFYFIFFYFKKSSCTLPFQHYTEFESIDAMFEGSATLDSVFEFTTESIRTLPNTKTYILSSCSD